MERTQSPHQSPPMPQRARSEALRALCCHSTVTFSCAAASIWSSPLKKWKCALDMCMCMTAPLEEAFILKLHRFISCRIRPRSPPADKDHSSKIVPSLRALGVGEATVLSCEAGPDGPDTPQLHDGEKSVPFIAGAGDLSPIFRRSSGRGRMPTRPRPAGR